MMAFDRLSTIIPPDQALANKALQAALLQITGISSSRLGEFAKAVIPLETNRSLSLVNGLTTAIPESVYQYYIDTFIAGQGTGPNGTLIVADVIGTPAGIPHSEQLSSVITELEALQNSGQLTSLTAIYQVMSNLVQGIYGIPPEPIIIPSGPGAGTYADYDTPMLILITLAITQFGIIITANPDSVIAMNTAYAAMESQLSREINNQALANIVYAEFTDNDKVSMQSFIQNLGILGEDNSIGSGAQIVEKVSDNTILGGQAIIGALREGRNLIHLENGGIGTATQVPDQSATALPQASTTSNIYTEDDAISRIVI